MNTEAQAAWISAVDRLIKDLGLTKWQFLLAAVVLTLAWKSPDLFRVWNERLAVQKDHEKWMKKFENKTREAREKRSRREGPKK